MYASLIKKMPLILSCSPVGLRILVFVDSLPGHRGSGAVLLEHLKAAAKETDGMGGVVTVASCDPPSCN